MRRLETEYEVRAEYSYFPLHPDTPEQGRRLADLFAGREALIDEMQRRLRELMAAEGLAYAERTHTYNSRLAQELAVWGDRLGVTDPLHDALFHAYFVEGRNLARIEVLIEVAATAGLDPDEAGSVLGERRFAPTVDAHWSTARELGVSGVPTFVAGGYGVVGAQPYEALEALMERVGVARRSNPGTDR